MAITLTEKAASEVKKIITEQLAGPDAPAQVYLRMSVKGGGCSGFQNKLDLDKEMNPKMDELIEQHGVNIVVDRRSLMYLTDVTVDFHEDINKRGFSISNPAAKTTCGCGSSFSM
ncbi:MAG: iron-sulfur cluster assembly accessory protein [Planctomycetes bacterium]|nr:iron-sulfur cluster assembly accessory protein [Planctomycetota bacterium]